MADVMTSVAVVTQKKSTQSAAMIEPQRPATRQDQPGSLSKFEDEQNGMWWEYVGDNTLTGSQVASHILAHEARVQENARLELAAQQPEVLQALSDMAFGPNKAHTPIPSDTVYTFSLKSMMQHMAPFLEQYAEAQLRQDTGLDTTLDEQNRLLGHVRTDGVYLPLI